MDSDITLWATLIGNLGFPIFVACFLLFRSDKLLRELTTAVQQLTMLIKQCLKEK